MSNFRWSSKLRMRGIHWKSWDYMCQPKNKGGPGFKRFTQQNSSLLSKQVWRCIQSFNDYWATILRGICCSREDFWEVKPKAGISWAWRSLLHGRDLLKAKGMWIVRNRSKINIREDNWLLFWTRPQPIEVNGPASSGPTVKQRYTT